MTPKPEEAVVQLHNELMELDYSEIEALARIAWQLRAIARKRPGDFRVRYSLAEAYARLGERDDALSEIRVAAGLRSQMPEAMAALAHSLAGLGEIKAATEMMHCLPTNLHARAADSQAAAVVAVLAGDVDMLGLYAGEDNEDSFLFASRTLRVLDENGILEALPEHAAAIRDTIVGTTTLVEFWIDDLESAATVVIRFFSTLPFVERIKQKKDLGRRLRNLYSHRRRSGRNPAQVLSVMLSGIPAKEHPAAA
jgi:hypothetical protein